MYLPIQPSFAVVLSQVCLNKFFLHNFSVGTLEDRRTQRSLLLGMRQTVNLRIGIEEMRDTARARVSGYVWTN